MMPDPISGVVAELLDRLGATPFSPFEIVLSNGERYPIPTPDHLTITRLLRRIEVEADNGRVTTINPLHIANIGRPP